MTPRMRTIAESAAELKAIDPHTAVTFTAIRRMVLSGEIPHIRAGNKRLINLDGLLEHLAAPPNPTPGKAEYGVIRPVELRERRA